jgi:transcription elongation factor
VYSGPFQGTVGCVVSINDADIVQIETLLDNVLIEVPCQNIQRAFSCGDLVAIVCGEFQGREGFITDIYGAATTLYSIELAEGSDNQIFPGEEVGELPLVLDTLLIFSASS